MKRELEPAKPAWRTDDPVRVGVSSCLLGSEVRWDGGHKREPYLVETLGRWFEWVPVCPEMEIGLGAPRESLRLIGKPLDPRLVAPASGSDHTDAMKAYARARLKQLAEAGLHGYVLKKDSPSCGLWRVRVHGKRGLLHRNGVGAFARVLVERLPNLPVEEEGRLADAALRENFVERIFCRHRWRTRSAPIPSAATCSPASCSGIGCRSCWASSCSPSPRRSASSWACSRATTAGRPRPC